VSTTLILTPLDDRGIEILNALEAEATLSFRTNLNTGVRSHWVNAQGVPPDGYEAALERLSPDWREHLAAA
jgi:hypothetical protein